MNLGDAYKATVVSLLPLEIREEKSGLYPGRFTIPASKDGKPSVLVIDESRHYVYLDGERGQMPVRNPAILVAEAIVNDFVNACLGVEPGIGPGLFCVPGRHSPEEIELNFSEELNKARDSQLNWYKKLVMIADDDWEKYHRHTAISHIQRIAAKALGLDRPWIEVIESTPPITCPLCQSQIPGNAIVCPNCKCVLDRAKYEQFELAR
jgi:hypothetical protein